MNATMMEVTPETAAKWLESSQGNPRYANKMCDKKKVEVIARDILAGDWHQGSNAIVLDDAGHLKEGHHRCAAIVAANKPVMALVIFGMPAENQRHIDDNQARSVAQRLSIGPKTPAVINVHLCMMKGSAHYRPSAEEILRYYERNRAELDAVASTLSASNQRGPASQVGTLHAMYCAYRCGVSLIDLDTFRRVVQSGFADGDEQSAAIVLRNQYLLNPPGGGADRYTQSTNAQMAIKMFTEGKPRRKIFKEKRAYYFDLMKGEEQGNA